MAKSKVPANAQTGEPREDDAARMRAAADRLKELLADPGPGITVRPVAARDEEGLPLGRPVGAPADPAGDARHGHDAHGGGASGSSQHTPETGEPARGATVAAVSTVAAPDTHTPDKTDPHQALKARLARTQARKAARSAGLAGSPLTSPAQQGPAGPNGAPGVPGKTQPRQGQPDAPAADVSGSPPVGRKGSSQHQKLQKLERFVEGPRTAPQPPPDARIAAPPTTQDRLINRLNGDGELGAALRASRSAFVATGLFSCVVNILMLAGPLFMLQVYDRVMTSGSVPTLVALSILTAGIYVIIGLLEVVRSRVLVRVGVEVDQRITTRIFDAALRRSVAGPGHSVPALRELEHLRGFLSSPGLSAMFDVPWTPLYLLVIFLMHPWLGIAATFGAAVLLGLAWAGEIRSRGALIEAGKASGRSLELAEAAQRNAEVLHAMGMNSAFRNRWSKLNQEALAWQMLVADRLGSITAISRTMRLMLQSMMLAIGAALALQGEISAGVIVGATIIFGRALAPVEQAVGHWRQFLKARDSYDKLDDLLRKEPEPPKKTVLPEPSGHVAVSNLRVAAPQTRQLILAQISFAVRPGEMLAVIGPSASGKSSLIRALVGLWPPLSGTITLDGARIDQWEPEALGKYIGYLPQSVELFAGTVRENIARFDPAASDEMVVSAAKQARAHDLIMNLPDGYDTLLGPTATHLSGGQQQRIALARALFGSPKLIVLDEPNANLDRLGDVALSEAIDGMRERGQAVILVSHRVQAIGKADTILYIDKGVQRAFGPRAEILEAIKTGQLDAPFDRRQGDRRSAARAGGRRAEDKRADDRSAQMSPHAPGGPSRPEGSP